MNDNIWLAEDGRLLKDLRTSAGLNIHEFARASSISSAQLRQLEEGGDGVFYSPNIKFQMGRKLLRKLGADIVRASEASLSETPSLFDAPQAATPMADQPAALRSAPPVLPTRAPAARVISKRWVGASLLGFGLLLVAGIFGEQLLNTDNVSSDVAAPVSAPQVTVPVAASPQLLLNQDAPETPVTPVTPSPIEQASLAQAPTPTDEQCTSSEGAGKTFIPKGMDKPSTYVHFMASADVSICVEDRNKKITPINLKAGEKFTVHGSAPWRIRSPHWAEISVFFQGYRMPVPANASLVTLTPRTEPTVNPSTPSF